MGKLSHDPQINHFSHPHTLELCNNQQSVHITSCSACGLQCSGWTYSCRLCNFNLHASCSEMPTLITHPAHPMHPLNLLTTPAYAGGGFNCDGCGCQGHGFNYHCSYCDFDLHITCAVKPLAVAHQSHPHQLNLTFRSPYITKGFSCDICRGIGSNHWLYRCDACEFDAHLECAASPVLVAPGQPQLHHHNSLPVHNQYQQRGGVNVHLQHSQTLPARTIYQQPEPRGFTRTSYQQPTGGPMQANYQQPTGGPMHQQPAGGLMQATYQQSTVVPMKTSYQQPTGIPMQASDQQQIGGVMQTGYNQQSNSRSSGNTLVDAIVQGFIDGAAQQAGQMFLQGITGAGANNGGSNTDANGNYDDSSSPSVISIGSSILSGMFGDS